ncbi:VOC family protein [Paraglaciecola aquimarina]|uniref:VOC family protein n=1 Tax=Paraglaciecola algarum TaxID=3050085 RepID=A0ABS9D111_9ALTE|nr:VOC family protein [Paraglaciecola sp. G1-23]MCF2946619.1 VOC family protein [Paraglaciecola sp. G1-23]
MSQHHKINYIEIPVKAMASSKAFFRKVFGWEFVDYGDDYAAITGAGIDGGLFVSENYVAVENGSVLLVLYSDDLVQSQKDIEAAGGKIKVPTFEFPGGKRFHFCDRNGNEYAIWSDK